MPPERKCVGSFEQILHDLLWPVSKLCPDPEESLRHLAVAGALHCMPEEDSQKLSEDAFTLRKSFWPQQTIKADT